MLRKMVHTIGFKLFMVLALTFASVTNSFAVMNVATDAHQPEIMSEHCGGMMQADQAHHMSSSSEMECGNGNNTCTTCCAASCTLTPVILSQLPERAHPFVRRMAISTEHPSLIVQVKPNLYRPPIG